jgi:hypothetical protein
MSKDNLNQLFERLQGRFDFEQPKSGHQDRFLSKRNRYQPKISIENTRYQWRKPLSIAASIALFALLGLKFLLPEPSVQKQLVYIAPEVSKAEFYFAGLIQEQLKQLNDEKSPENAKLVDDTLVQLQRLENDYKKLTQDLVKGVDTKIILNASITNFQIRINLLNEVLGQIENIKNLKMNNDERFTI